MKLKNWMAGASALGLISVVTAGCGGGGSSSLGGGTTGGATASASLSATSGSQPMIAPQVSNLAVDPTTGATTATLTDPATGSVLSNVVVPADTSLQPHSGQPALVINASALNLGVTFAAHAKKAHAAGGGTPVSYVSLYSGSGTDSAHLLLKAGIGSDGKLLNSVAIAAVAGTYTIDFAGVIANTKPGTSLTINALDFVFQTRVTGGQVQTTLPTSLSAVLPAFGEQITHDASKPDWTGGGILIGLDPTAAGGVAELFVDQANGQIDAQSTIGNDGQSGGTLLTEILTKPNGPTMASPCRKVQLTCSFTK